MAIPVTSSRPSPTLAGVSSFRAGSRCSLRHAMRARTFLLRREMRLTNRHRPMLLPAISASPAADAKQILRRREPSLRFSPDSVETP